MEKTTNHSPKEIIRKAVEFKKVAQELHLFGKKFKSRGDMKPSENQSTESVKFKVIGNETEKNEGKGSRHRG